MTPRRLGQHFLTDSNLLRKIAAALDPDPDDVVLEIGPGKGSLTDIVAPQVARVLAIEMDRRLAQELSGREKREAGSITIVHGDALELDWHTLISDASRRIPLPASRFPAFKVFGNIPYYITSPLIEKALTPPLPERIVFLMQREVAERLGARPGTREYGALSVGVQTVCRVEQLFVIKAGAFRPPPRVDSAVVRLTPLAVPLVQPEEVVALRGFVTACFGRRRKQLRNAVMGATGQSAEEVTGMLGALALAPTLRPESLTPQDFVRLLRATRGL